MAGTSVPAAGIVMLAHPPDELRVTIGYEEIVGGHHTPAELRRVVERVVQRKL